MRSGGGGGHTQEMGPVVLSRLRLRTRGLAAAAHAAVKRTTTRRLGQVNMMHTTIRVPRLGRGGGPLFRADGQRGTTLLLMCLT